MILGRFWALQGRFLVTFRRPFFAFWLHFLSFLGFPGAAPYVHVCFFIIFGVKRGHFYPLNWRVYWVFFDGFGVFLTGFGTFFNVFYHFLGPPGTQPYVHRAKIAVDNAKRVLFTPILAFRRGF